MAAGRITRGRLAGLGTTRLYPNVHQLTDSVAGPDDLIGRTREAVLYVRGEPPVVGGYAATELHGADIAPRGTPVELVVGLRRVRPRPGLTIRRDVLAPADIAEVDGLLVTTPERTAWDLVRRRGFVDGVVALDALARVGRFRPERLLDRPAGARGARRVAPAVEASDPRAGSRPETVMRLAMAQLGVPTPTLQFEVRDAQDFFVAFVDFGWEEFKVAAEYQGDVHRRDQEQWRRDQSRFAELASCGWIVVPCTADDLRFPLQFVRRLCKTLALRGCVL
ncbi:type IV toxin-antitoxin system AbiEi family antitoxin [Actinomycetospora soli]|uniref:type IV toxin-antitoxin system AbiEi family antitoxin n=1 Tax=Actinomycetospora soli TaxID=2893887 RepID=UPI001E3847CE|nr:type IV toxin-antitoxin system AbiEi family antitoxin [Actinomycetospora soli]MCD2187625.1 type IV toxin-antitoxin system AbiEi family antitoxin [Actinomycetospora soli]